MTLPQLHTFPLVTAFLFPITFALTYTLAVTLGHTDFDWPYISDTATYPPESCIFSQLVNIGALLVGITFYIRYKQVGEYCSSHQVSSHLFRLNTISLYIGWLAAAGLSILANFQETEVFAVHMVGAFSAFGFGSVYLWTQVLTSYLLHPLATNLAMLWFRGILATVSSLAFILMTVTGEIASSEFSGTDPTKWGPEDGGWDLHVVSTASEWIIAVVFDIFILSLIPEFRKIQLDSPRICLRIDPGTTLLEVNASFQDDFSADLLS